MKTSSKKLSTYEILEAIRDALATSLTRQQQVELTRLSPEIIDYYAGLATTLNIANVSKTNEWASPYFR